VLFIIFVVVYQPKFFCVF